METNIFGKVELEEYKRNLSVYKTCKEKLSDLRNQKHELERRLDMGWIAGMILFFGCYAMIIIFVIAVNTLSVPLFVVSAFMFYAFHELEKKDSRVANLLSFGKRDKINAALSSIEIQEKEIIATESVARNKLRMYEEVVREYYENLLNDFYQNKLFNKRSGSREFNESLSEFSSMLDEISLLNKNLVTNRVYVSEYREYIQKRAQNHALQSVRNSERVDSIRNFKNTVSVQAKEKLEVEPPETYFRVPRKIKNWDEINRKRNMTGAKGEEVVVVMEQEYLKSINRDDLSEKVRHVSLVDGDGAGYDVQSFFANGRTKFIEVKSTTSSLASPYYLSRNELGFLKEHQSDAFVYRVLLSSQAPEVETHSGLEILEVNEIVPVQYVVQVKK